MRRKTMFTILVTALGLMFWSAPIVHGAQYLMVNGQDVTSITLELGQSRTVEIVSTDGTSYVDYTGFDNGLVLGAFSYLETRKEAGNLATAIEYDQPTFYGYYVNATGISPTPSAGVHFIFEYLAQQVGETDLKLYDSTFTTVIDSIHITVIPLQPLPIGTAFTYQGRLMDSNSPANGLYDFEFKLYDNPDPVFAAQQGNTIDINDLDVIDGYFTAELDFGSSVFDGNAVWLEILVRPGDSNDPNDFITLNPRQEVTPTPYALYAKTAGNALTGSGTTNRIAKFTGTNTLGNSALYEHNYHVGVGTTNPRGMFDVDCDSGDIYLDTFSSQVYIGDVDGDGEGTLFIVDDDFEKFTFENGKVGIGTTTPRASLEVTNTGTSHAIWASTSEIPVYAHRTGTGGTWPAVAGDCNSQASNASGVRGRILSTSPGSLGAGVYGYNYGTGSNGVGVRGHHAGNGYAGYFTGGKNYFEGNVGIGTTNPSEKLDVEGNIDVSSNRVKNYKGFPRPDYDSGWVSIAQNQSLQFLHNIGGDPDDYVVDVQGKDLEGMGVNIHGFGCYVDTGATYSVREGFYWHNLTSSYIRVLRLKENTSADQVRVRIWVYN